jgi:hypothetical protein
MIYTEYFVRGSEPTTLCPVHPGPFTNVVAGMDGIIQPTPQPGVDDAHMPPAKVPTSGVVPPPPAAETAEPVHGGQVPASAEPAQKKRGFWGKLFGRGDKDKDKKKGG